VGNSLSYFLVVWGSKSSFPAEGDTSVLMLVWVVRMCPETLLLVMVIGVRLCPDHNLTAQPNINTEISPSTGNDLFESHTTRKLTQWIAHFTIVDARYILTGNCSNYCFSISHTCHVHDKHIVTLRSRFRLGIMYSLYKGSGGETWGKETNGEAQTQMGG